MTEILFVVLINVLSFIIGFIFGNKLFNFVHCGRDTTQLNKALLENIDGVTSVQLSPVRYAELVLAEDDLRELRLKLKDI